MNSLRSVQLSIAQYVAPWISNGNFSRVKLSKTVRVDSLLLLHGGITGMSVCLLGMY